MKIATLTGVGGNMGVALPWDFVRSLGWVKGDKLALSIEGGDIVIRNSSQRAARFTRDFKARPENRVQADTR
jgi:antitoxin component of MazEF toxin-antitoxin module